MPTDSFFPRIDLPNVDIWSFLFENRSRPYPDNKVLFLDADTDRTYTYAQVKDTAIDFGKGLKGVWDWQKGDVLAFFTSNCIDTPAITWGCHWAGGIASPANPAYTAEELAFQLKDAGAKALVTQISLLPTAEKAAKMVGLPSDRIIVMGDQREPGGRIKHFTSIRNISGVSRFRRAKLDPDKDLAFLVYSSGTTGHPKGVMLSHFNVVSNILQLKAGEEGNMSWRGHHQDQGDKILAFLPFYHIYGLVVILHQCVTSGLQAVVMPRFDLEKSCQLIQRHKITFLYVAPPVILALAKHPVVSKYDLSSVRMINSGAAPLTRELVESMYERLKIPVKQGYGLSETSPTTHTQRWSCWNKPIGSAGIMMPNMTAKFMSPEEKEVPVGETGELWLKGPNIFKGYLNNPEMTAQAITPDGYFKTGDIGHQDKDGNIFITDRVKELIKYKGFQVAPAELEGLLLSHDLIADCAVIGLYKKDEATEVPKAYVVVKQDVEQTSRTAEIIASWLNKRVANHKKIRGGVVFVPEIPKSPSGKILRRLLKLKAQDEEDARNPRAKL